MAKLNTRHPLRHLVASMVLLLSALNVLTAQAADSPANGDSDRYRAEIVLFERNVNPASLVERMSNEPLPTLPDDARTLWVDTPDGSPYTDMDLIDGNKLFLASAAARLRSHGYKVLLTTGWNGSFPPGYQSKPLIVKLGEQVQGYSKVEGYIQISRQRYLHVTANLTELQFVQAQLAPVGAGPNQPPAQAEQSSSTPVLFPEPMDSPPTQQVPQVLTWLKETRRMRSQEIHYLDSPTLGLLVYFQPLSSGPDSTQADTTASSQ